MRLAATALVIAVVVVNVIYWQDPWLWRRYFNTFAQLAGSQPRLLEPNEIVRGDGSHVFPVADANARTVSDQALAAAVEFAQRFDSYALVVVHNGAIQGEWYAEGWDRESLTQSQSMHKSLQALLIGVAIEGGLVDATNDPISRYVEEWRDDPRGEVTLEQLMMMSSGLGQDRVTLNPFTDEFRWLYSGDTAPVVLRTPQADWAPGEKFDYNNINSELLGLTLQRASGRRYAEYLEDALWTPMGGGDASVWLDSRDGDAYTSCCLMATARDWARVGLVMLNRGEFNGQRIVSGEWIDRMVAASPVSAWYGLQTWLGYEPETNPRAANVSAAGAYERSEPFLAPDVYYFSGRGAQRVYVVPSRQLVIVRLGPALGPRPLKPGWDNGYLVNTIIRGLLESGGTT